MAENVRGNRPLSPRMHRFCLGIVEGAGPTEAYRLAYRADNMAPESIAVEAARLMRDRRVKARIETLHQSLQRALGVSRATLLKEIEDIAAAAASRGQLRTALSAIELKVRLLGFADHVPIPVSPSEQASAFAVLDAGQGE
jgi:phage terminase small subunit